MNTRYFKYNMLFLLILNRSYCMDTMSNWNNLRENVTYCFKTIPYFTIALAQLPFSNASYAPGTQSECWYHCAQNCSTPIDPMYLCDSEKGVRFCITLGTSMLAFGLCIGYMIRCCKKLEKIPIEEEVKKE